MFLMKLEICGELREFPELDREPDYDEEDDGIVGVIMDLCKILSETNCVKFTVSGFGQNNWPVNIKTDMSIILEELPIVIKSLSKGLYPFSLAFCEQGPPRDLVFEGRDNDLVTITCKTWTDDWTGISPTTIKVNYEDIEHQLVTLKNSFIDIVSIVIPKLASSELFKLWCASSD